MKAWGITDRGIVRTQNQDTYRIEELANGSLVGIVCDGMGGARAGNVASALAADVFIDELKRSVVQQTPPEKLDEILNGAISLANRTVYEQSCLGEEFAGMGTTLICALAWGNKALVANIGDSRAYHINRSGIEQISKDHSVVEDLIHRGDLTPEEARNHPSRNLITRALGTELEVECDLFSVDLEPGDTIVLCSDGLSNMVTDQELLNEVSRMESKEECCPRLLEISKTRGAPDNVTIVLIEKEA